MLVCLFVISGCVHEVVVMLDYGIECVYVVDLVLVAEFEDDLFDGFNYDEDFVCECIWRLVMVDVWSVVFVYCVFLGVFEVVVVDDLIGCVSVEVIVGYLFGIFVLLFGECIIEDVIVYLWLLKVVGVRLYGVSDLVFVMIFVFVQ